MAQIRVWAVMPLVALAGLLFITPWGHTAAPAAWDRAVPSPAAPNADWLDDLIDDMDDADDEVDDAEAIVGEQQGPLSGTDLTRVEADLDNTLAIIDRILDPMKYPSLDPPDAGEIDYSVSPGTLPKYADKCLELIQEAAYEARYGAADSEYIGSRLKTIEHLITRAHPHSYKSKAGIE